MVSKIAAAAGGREEAALEFARNARRAISNVL